MNDKIMHQTENNRLKDRGDLLKEEQIEDLIYADLDETTKKIFKQYMSQMYPDYWNGVLPQMMKDFTAGKAKVDFGVFYNLDFMQHLSYPRKKSTDRIEILSAGCGTGEAELFLAINNPKAQITAVDLSENSLKRAKGYAGELKLKNISYFHENLMEMQLEKQFDIIISCGVIHHLSSPAKGLENLKKHLKPNGIMIIMVYGEYGRHEITLFQEAIKLIQKDQLDFIDGIKVVREFLSSLPVNSLFKSIQHKNNIDMGDNHIVDLLLNLNENRYTVKTLNDLVENQKLKIISFFPQNTYNPNAYTQSNFLSDKFEQLSYLGKAYLAELINGHISKHGFICTHIENDFTMPSMKDKDADKYVPYIAPYIVETKKSDGYSLSINPEQMGESPFATNKVINLKQLNYEIYKAVGGRRSFKDIYKQFKNQIQWEAYWELMKILVEYRLIYVHID